METQAFIARILDEMSGEIHGRIQLQKLVYFCKAFGAAVDANYGLYIYGPFSQKVADSLQEGVMEEVFSETRGSIKKGEAYQQYKEKMAAENRFCEKEGNIIQDVVKTFGGLTIDQLEILATTFFIYRQQNTLFGKAEKETVLDKVGRAKASRFTPKQIEDAYTQMQEVCFPLEKKYA